MADPRDQDEFARLLSEVQENLYRYIFTLVPRDADASDILQETVVALWRKFDQFDRALPFGAWARRFAFTEVSKFRSRKAREGEKRGILSENALEQVSAEFEEHAGVLELRLSALETCVGKLTEQDRELLKARYWKGSNLRQLAEQRNANEDQLYRRLAKIRSMLDKCIEKTIAAEGI